MEVFLKIVFIALASVSCVWAHTGTMEHLARIHAQPPLPMVDSENLTYVTCKFAGELGNQMYQIATTMSYALDHQCVPVFPDIHSAAAGAENWAHVFWRLQHLVRDGIHFEDYHHPYHYSYGPIAYTEGKNLRLLGYYMNEQYFAHHREYIVQLFAPSDCIIQHIQNRYGALEEIFKEPVVAVHVRTFIPSGRHPDRDGFGGASWDYFVNAIYQFPENYTFFVFSDDPQWTRQNFPRIPRNIHFISGNPHYIDFYFMSLCHHQIVSPESTFSWWAAYLNTNPEQIVIVPHCWQQLYAEDPYYEGSYPAGWKKIYAPQIH